MVRTLFGAYEPPPNLEQGFIVDGRLMHFAVGYEITAKLKEGAL
jgi:hypothetical protein